MGVACSACVIYQIKEFSSLLLGLYSLHSLYFVYCTYTCCTAVAMIINLRYGIMIAYLAPRTRKEKNKNNNTIPANSTT